MSSHNRPVIYEIIFHTHLSSHNRPVIYEIIFHTHLSSHNDWEQESYDWKWVVMFLRIFVNDRFKIDSGGSLRWLLNSLCVWPYDATWRNRFLSWMVQIMAWCLMAPSHYLNQCWLIVNGTLRNASEWNFNKYVCNLNRVSQPTELSMAFCSLMYFLLTDTVSCGTVDGTGMVWSKHWFPGLTHWNLVIYMYTSLNCVIIDSLSDMSLVCCKDFTWTNVELLLIGQIATNFS